MTAPSMLAAALGYAAAGWPVFPCIPRGKEPAVKRGFHSATTNPETIKRLWSIADRNIGIPTGAASCFWVLDLDGEDGEASIERLQATHGALPVTREVITGGGRHLWFRYSGPIPSSTGKIARGIDTRGDGGYVIAPPSVHASGKVYAWGHTRDIAAAPDWLIQLTRKRPTISGRALAVIARPQSQHNGLPGSYGRAALESEIAALANMQRGCRNHALNRVTFALFQLVAGGELERDQVVPRLIDACHRNGLVQDDGMKSVIATIRSGSHAGPQHPRSRGAA